MIATAPPAIVLPDGTYRYRFEARGTVRTSTVVVRHETGLIVIDEGTATENVPIVTQRRIDPSTFATRSYAIDAGDTHAVVTISGNEATVTQGNIRESVHAAPGAPFVVTENLVGAWAQLPATLYVTGAKKVTFACPCGEFVAISVSVVSNRDGVLRVHGSDGVDAILSYDPQTFVLRRLEVPAQKVVIALQSQSSHVARLNFVVPTPLPLPPANYASRDVAIRADDGVTLPERSRFLMRRRLRCRDSSWSTAAAASTAMRRSGRTKSSHSSRTGSRTTATPCCATTSVRAERAAGRSRRGTG